MALLREQVYTIDDIYALPEGERAELIGGRIFYMAPPGRMHQKIVFAIGRKIADYIDCHGGKCEVDLAPFAVFLDDDNSTYVEPDISVVCDLKKLDEKGCHGAPDWIVEVVSPGSKRMDYYTKLSLYKESGVRDYWIVDPMKMIVVVYYLDQDEAPVLYGFEDKIKANIYEDFEIDFNDLDIE
ncbi:Uma2 family endonuclease [Bariatricus sp. HCP28S3_C2]|uniref:Uma2 family endonuclease n=1 Tax=unclassified Bariatricus TaxID=2677046 RepID=UPI003EFE8013